MAFIQCNPVVTPTHQKPGRWCWHKRGHFCPSKRPHHVFSQPHALLFPLNSMFKPRHPKPALHFYSLIGSEESEHSQRLTVSLIFCPSCQLRTKQRKPNVLPKPTTEMPCFQWALISLFPSFCLMWACLALHFFRFLRSLDDGWEIFFPCPKIWI